MALPVFPAVSEVDEQGCTEDEGGRFGSGCQKNGEDEAIGIAGGIAGNLAEVVDEAGGAKLEIGAGRQERIEVDENAIKPSDGAFVAVVAVADAGDDATIGGGVRSEGFKPTRGGMEVDEGGRTGGAVEGVAGSAGAGFREAGNAAGIGCPVDSRCR